MTPTLAAVIDLAARRSAPKSTSAGLLRDPRNGFRCAAVLRHTLLHRWVGGRSAVSAKAVFPQRHDPALRCWSLGRASVKVVQMGVLGCRSPKNHTVGGPRPMFGARRFTLTDLGPIIGPETDNWLGQRTDRSWAFVGVHPIPSDKLSGWSEHSASATVFMSGQRAQNGATCMVSFMFLDWYVAASQWLMTDMAQAHRCESGAGTVSL